MIKNNFKNEGYIAPPEDRFIEKESTKNHNTVGVLALLFGTFGVDDFYLGNTQKGIICFVLALFIGWSILMRLCFLQGK